MKKYLVEFIGTFFLVLTVGCTVLAGHAEGVIPPLAIGSALMIMVYSGGHISGGHFNPAVTLACVLRGATPTKDMLPYWGAQILGGIVAALTAQFVVGTNGDPAAPLANVPAAFVGELLFTFALAWVVLQTATAKGTEGNSFYGLAIGFTVLVGAFAVGHVSGGAFNPAVAIGAAVMNLASAGNIWVHIVAALAGGALAALAFKATNPASE